MASQEINLPATPTRAHDANLNRREQSLPLFHLPTMDHAGDHSGLKHRFVAGQGGGSSDVSDRDLSSSGATLTPVSSRQSSVTEDSFLQTVRRRWSKLFEPSDAAIAAKEEEKQRRREFGYADFIKEERADIRKYAPGFPLLAAWTGDDDDRAIYRQFKYARNRLLVQLEDEVTWLETELEELDKADVLKEAAAMKAGKWTGSEYRLRRGRHGEKVWDTAQTDLMQKMGDKLKEYDYHFFTQARYESFPRATERAHRSYFNLSREITFWDRSGDFLLHQDDFRSIVTAHSSWAHQVIQYFVDQKPNWLVSRLLWKTLLRPESGPRDEDGLPQDGPTPGLTYFSTTAFDRLASGILVILCVGILLIPAFLLFLLPMSRPLMAVTASVFIVVYSVLISVTTEADPFKIFVGTATYAALVVMFLGNMGGTSCAAS